MTEARRARHDHPLLDRGRLAGSPLVEPFTLAAAIAAGAAYRLFRGKRDLRARTRTLDQRHDRILPADWRQEGDLLALAQRVADRDGRALDHVLAQYGCWTYRGGTRTMNRKRLKRVEANEIIARIQREQRVTLAPTGEGWKRQDPLEPRDDEESF